MERKAKSTTRDTTPTVLVSVGVVSSQAGWEGPNGDMPEIMSETAIQVSRKTRGRWVSGPIRQYRGWRDVWDALDTLCAPGRRVYVVSGRASDTLTLLHWWELLARGWCTVIDRRAAPAAKSVKPRRHPLIIGGCPDVIGYTRRGTSFRWVSVTNWCQLSIADAAAQVGADLGGHPVQSDKWEDARIPAESQAEIITKYMIRLFDWWVSNRCGVWQDTPGAASWASYRRRCGDSAPTPHTDPDAMGMESRACFGGRASAFYFGAIGNPERWTQYPAHPVDPRRSFGLSGPVHRYDVRSMYPELLRSQSFPVRLLRHCTRTGVDGLRRGLRHWLAIADVVLRTRRPIFPQRWGESVRYPVGRFRTTLTTPELIAALESGEVEKVLGVSWYVPGRPFEGWADWVLGLRRGMRDAGDAAGEAMVKLLANSLGGRLARRKVGWELRPNKLPRVLWGHWWETDADSGETVEFRSLCGHVQEMVKSADRPATLAACFAHLTAYGRARMNRVREVCGNRQVLWQDTDGLIVTDVGAARLERSEHYRPDEFGGMRYQSTYADALFLTAKHYWTDGEYTLCGIHDGFVPVGDGLVADTVTVNPCRSAIEPDTAAVFRAARVIDVGEIDPGVRIDPNGWSIPPVSEHPDPAGGVNPAEQLPFCEG